MTNLDDIDRSLAGFLADGPTTAPEAPVIAALAHARTAPRRADLLRRFRPDVMADRAWRPFGLRPALVLGLLALLAAGIGAAVIGSRPTQQPAVTVPSPSDGPTAVATPSSLPSSTPAPAESASIFSQDVPMLVSAGTSFPIHVTDTTGDLLAAVSIQPGDGASADGVQIKVDPKNLSALIVTWVGSTCESNGSLSVDESSHTIAILRDPCQGDALPLDRIVRLTFSGFVQAGDWTSSIDNGSASTGSATP
jgi:hypothetical protein